MVDHALGVAQGRENVLQLAPCLLIEVGREELQHVQRERDGA